MENQIINEYEHTKEDYDELYTEYLELKVDYYKQKIEYLLFLQTIKSFKKYLIFKSEDCCICQEKIKNDIKILECGHPYHNECLKKCNKKECPLCRLEYESYDSE